MAGCLNGYPPQQAPRNPSGTALLTDSTLSHWRWLMARSSEIFDNYQWIVPLLENSVWIGVYALGSVIFSYIHPLASGAYLVYSLSCMYLLLPLLVCTSCSYYGRTCHSGQGQIASLLFSPQDKSEFSARFRHMRLAAPVFLAPLLAGVVLLFVRFSPGLAVSILAFGILALGCTRLVTKRLGCPHCQQQHVCPACQHR
jgi:hypothetical protein